MAKKHITITKAAEEYLRELITRHDQTDLAIHMSIEKVDEESTELCLAFCSANSLPEHSAVMDLGNLTIFVDKTSTAHMKGAKLDLVEVEGVPHLSLTAARQESENDRALMESFAEQYRRGLIKR